MGMRKWLKSGWLFARKWMKETENSKMEQPSHNKDEQDPSEQNQSEQNKRDESKSRIYDNAVNGAESALVVVVFLVFYNLLDLRWAIGATTLSSLWFTYSRYRRGKSIGKVLPIATALIVGRGIAGIITDSRDVYFGIGIGVSVAFGVALAISALIRKNLLALAVPYFFDFPEHVKKHDLYISTLNRLAYFIGVYYVVKAGFDVWLLDISSTNQFVIIRTIVGWPLGLAVFWGSVGYAARRLAKIPNWEGFRVMMERQAEIYKEAFSNRFSRASRFARRQKEVNN